MTRATEPGARPWRLVFTALHGGSGASATAAGVLLAWPHQGAIQLIDADPANRARQALGLGLASADGWVRAHSERRAWLSSLLPCTEQAAVLPYGEWAPAQPAPTPEAWQAGLDSLPACAVQLIVSGPPGTPCSALVRHSADLVCVVATPDMLVSTPPARLRALLGETGVLLINRFRPERRADLSLLGLARRHWARWLLPTLVHDDAAVSEALWQRQPLHVHAPASQAAHDYAALASLLQQLRIGVGVPA